MLIIAAYFKTEGFGNVKNFLACVLLGVAIFYVFGLLLIAGVIASSFLLMSRCLYKSFLLGSFKCTAKKLKPL